MKAALTLAALLTLATGAASALPATPSLLGAAAPEAGVQTVDYYGYGYGRPRPYYRPPYVERRYYGPPRGYYRRPPVRVVETPCRTKVVRRGWGGRQVTVYDRCGYRGW